MSWSWSPDETGLEEEPSLPEPCALCDRKADDACAVCDAPLCAYHVESQGGLCQQCAVEHFYGEGKG